MKSISGLSWCAIVLAFAAVQCADVVTEAPTDGGTGGNGGAVDPCATNLCECDEDGDCSAHEFCDTSGPGRLCQCVPAYQDMGDGCTFAEAPEDPGFEDGTPWEGTPGAGVNPVAAGDVDPGEAFFNENGVCNLSTVSQTFAMPGIDESEPFAVDVNFRQDLPAFGFDQVGAAIAINGAWNELESQDFFSLQTFCLGESGYGGDVSFVLSPSQVSRSCASQPETTFAIDRFAVRVATSGECPEPGTASNGNFEDSTGWEFVTRGDGVGEFAPGAGVGGSRGARLRTTTRCSSAAARGTVSIPAGLADAAIAFSLTGNNSTVELQLGERPVSSFVPSGAQRRVCLPDWAEGSGQTLTLTLPQIHSTGDCDIAFNRDVVIDNIQVVSEPACGEDNEAYDLGFETPPNSSGAAPGWAARDGAVNSVLAPGSIIQDAGLSRSGNGVLRLTATNRCNGAVSFRQITVSQPDGDAGPAIKFFYNVPVVSGDSGLRLLDGSTEELVVSEGAGWQQATFCVPPRHFGRPLNIQLFTDGGGGGCADIPEEVGLFDDVEITTDSACPTN